MESEEFEELRRTVVNEIESDELARLIRERGHVPYSTWKRLDDETIVDSIHSALSFLDDAMKDERKRETVILLANHIMTLSSH